MPVLHTKVLHKQRLTVHSPISILSSCISYKLQIDSSLEMLEKSDRVNRIGRRCSAKTFSVVHSRKTFVRK